MDLVQLVAPGGQFPLEPGGEDALSIGVDLLHGCHNHVVDLLDILDLQGGPELSAVRLIEAAALFQVIDNTLKCVPGEAPFDELTHHLFPGATPSTGRELTQNAEHGQFHVVITHYSVDHQLTGADTVDHPLVY